MRNVLLVGSAPLENSTAVFRAAASALGDRLRRMPDGETSERLGWVGWQSKIFSSNPGLEMMPPTRAYAPLPKFKLRAPGRRLKLGELGYARTARDSYAEFARLRAEGVIASRCRFQVSLPTPLAPVCAFVDPGAQAEVEPVYEARLLAELDEICGAIPHQALAIQWDVAFEIGILEGVFAVHFSDLRSEILTRLARIGDRVPADIELGYHLCYGDYAHHHFKQPDDAARLVDSANAVVASVNRPVEWIHLPVPRERDDDRYFAPLADLRLASTTELYLGLIHLTDGVVGARRRLAAATRATAIPFGVATECGFGRRPPETIAELLRLHAEVADL